MSEYTWNAQEYEIHSKEQQKWARELISKLNLKGTEDILDVGCGDGKVTVEISRCVPGGSVVGIDNSEAMISLANKHFAEYEGSNLSFCMMNAIDISFEDSFDIVFSNAALHWVLDHKPVITGIHRALRPGGRMLLQMGGKGNARGILSVLDDLRLKQPWRKYFIDFSFPYAFLDTGDYTRLLKDSGFINERVALIPKDMVHMGPSGLAGWIRTTWLPYTQRIPENRREEFIIDLVSEYLRKVPLDAAGKAHVAMMRLEVAAEKK
jgi:trans-aconitate methyltransferase